MRTKSGQSSNPYKAYSKKIEDSRAKLHTIKRMEIFLSLAKLILVIGEISLIAVFVNNIPLFSVPVFVVLFTSAAVTHEYFIKKRKYQTALKKINEDELIALKERFLNTDCGSDLIDPQHDYISDLDIFGEKSIFHYVNRTTTSAGKKTLSNWLKGSPNVHPAEEIGERQEAVRELSGKLDLRQSIQVKGSFIEDSLQKQRSFQDLLKEPFSFLHKRALIIFIHVFPLFTLSFLVYMLFKISALNLPLALLIQQIFKWLLILLLILLFQNSVTRIFRKPITRIYRLVSKYSRIFNAYAQIVSTLEKQDFTSFRMKKIKQELIHDNKPASKYIRRLSTILGCFELRTNGLLYALLNNILFWDMHWAYRFERLKYAVGEQIPKWFDVIGQFEALSSLANTLYNNQEWTFPQISESELKLEAVSTGHPLIPEEERILNSIRFEKKDRIIIITGPNMAGKTTFLKTIGVNIILALAGSPVCARSFVTYPFRLCTSMKLSDSLDKKLSLFYAELLRLKMIYDAIREGEEKGKPVFYLIDEMLKGTNAMDRQKGSMALIRRLIEKRSKGMLATHDLKLTILEEKYPRKVKNYYFDGRIEGDKLVFDYKLKSGACRSSNALELMRKVGIKL
jgi:ABC-type multidrug transport system fused ATPase/permease subunit